MTEERKLLFGSIVFKDEETAKAMLAKSPEEVAAYATENGCEITTEEVIAIGEELKEYAAKIQSGELDEDALDDVAGGGKRWKAFWKGFAGGFGAGLLVGSAGTW